MTQCFQSHLIFSRKTFHPSLSNILHFSASSWRLLTHKWLLSSHCVAEWLIKSWLALEFLVITNCIYLMMLLSWSQQWRVWDCWAFRVFRHHPLYPRPSWTWSSPQNVTRRLFCYSVPHGSPLFSHSHCEALSAAWVTLWMSVYFFLPSMPQWLKALGRDLAAKPLQPASVGRHLALHTAAHQPLVNGELPFKRPVPNNLPKEW